MVGRMTENYWTTFYCTTFKIKGGYSYKTLFFKNKTRKFNQSQWSVKQYWRLNVQKKEMKNEWNGGTVAT